MINIKILGYGEIGKSIEKLIVDAKVYIHDLAPTGREVPEGVHVDYVLVCIPYSDTFLQTVLKEKCEKIIVFSTVPIGTLENVPNCCHVPIEGRHPDLSKHIEKWHIFLSVDNMIFLESYIAFFQFHMGKTQEDIRAIIGTKHTEALKLLSTLNYGVNILFADYVRSILGPKRYELWTEYTHAYNKVYEDDPGIFRYNLYPPIGIIGGHCVRQNATLLPDSVFTELVKKGGIEIWQNG